MSGAPHLTSVRVYYEDTDFSGVVYHANYLRFLERGRTEFLRDLGVAQSTLLAGPGAVFFAVAHIEVAFRRAARMDDMLAVETSVVTVAGASLTFRQRLLRRDELLVDASVRVAAVAGGRAVRLPVPLVSVLAANGHRALRPR